jgi:hypothetical protein
VFGTGTLEAKVVIGFSAKMIGKVVEVLVDQVSPPAWRLNPTLTRLILVTWLG